MKLGVCYYPEHWPEERWAEDARLMRQAGLAVVRIGEFAWAKMEPIEGQFAWEWLDKAIQTLTAQRLQVVLGTPTATPPAWLCRTYPEILPVDSQGQQRNFGSRRHYCHNNPIYRQHTARIVTALAQRYANTPGVIGWQIDNEFGCHDTARCYCPACAAAFRAWLQKRYTSLEALNRAWGADFWSQTYAAWGQIEPPQQTVTEPNPSHVLDYYRFSSDSVLEYQQLQIDLLRQHTHGQWITHNLMGNFPDLDYHALARPLDHVCWDSYPTGYAEVQAETLYMPGEPRPSFAYDAGDPYVTGFCHDLTRGLKQTPFWVMEQQAGNINWALLNTGVRPGTVRLWTWHALASGAEAVVYFRWRACLYAQEQYHSGLLRHDSSPDLGYLEVLRMAEEHTLMEKISAAPLSVDTALLLDYEDLWAIQLQPHRRDFGYLRHLFVFYRALREIGIMVDIVGPQSDLSRYRLILAPTAHLGRPELAEKLAACAQAGSVVLLGVRTGFKTTSNTVTDQPLPGAYAALAGVNVKTWHALPPGVGYPLEPRIEGLEGEAAFWAEALQPGSETNSLARYRGGPFAGQSALTEYTLGEGRVVYLGWYPSLAQAKGLAARLAEQARVARLAELPQGILGIRRGPHTMLFNFTEQEAEAQMEGKPVRIPPRDLLIV
jgi:beta-galactosidase